MAKLIWSSRALQDLDNACEYIAQDSKKYAYLLAERITTLVERIPENPLWGPVVPEYEDPDLRERLFQNYRIVYRVRENAVEVVSIVHAARMMPPKP